MRKYNLIFLILLCLFVFSCKNESTNEKKDIEIEYNTSLKKKEDITERIKNAKSNTYTKYNLPLPNEIFLVLDENESNFDLLNPSKNYKKYEETISKSLNLGVFSADMAYSVKYHNSQYFTEYFDVVQNLLSDLEIGIEFDYQLINRISFNKDNSDSIKIIADDLYWQICNNLEKNKKINILPFVIVGGWIEGVYVLTNSSEFELLTDEQTKEIIVQKVALKSLIEYLYEIMTESNAYYLNLDIKKIIENFEDLLSIYKKIDENNSVLITVKQFELLKNKVAEIRNSFI